MFTRTPPAIASEAAQRRCLFRIVGRFSSTGRLAALSVDAGLIANALILWRCCSEGREP